MSSSETAQRLPSDTPRLTFRQWQPDDLPLAMKLWGDPRVTALIDARGVLELAQVRERLERELLLQRQYEVQYWPVFLRTTGEFVGCCGLRPYHLPHGIYEAGVHLCFEAWGIGLAAEAMSAVIRFALEELGAYALFAGHNPRNDASRRLLQRLGFRYTHDELYPATGLYHPSYLLAAQELEPAVQDSVRYLASDASLASIELDPYWPKWDGPWWHIATLLELGRVRDVPGRTLDVLVAAVSRHYLRTFPFRLDELPPEYDPKRHVICHCALGTLYQALARAGRDVDRELPWIRPWFLRYQLPDGGLNCDEQVYTRVDPHGSVLSTLPPLEAVLLHTPRPFTPDEEAFLDRGAAYLTARRLFRSRRTGAIIDPLWLQLTFPRFYDYDILRGLGFLTTWADRRGQPLPRQAIDEACQRLRTSFPDGRLTTQVRAWQEVRTLAHQPDGTWAREPSRSFALLEQVSVPGRFSPWLTGQWREVQARLKALEARGLLIEER